ncbi:MAG: RNA polymerase sigma factor [Bacteroidales bacterium]|nr:RNA polymerase sigma factor [Bacteroidales bacterium]
MFRKFSDSAIIEGIRRQDEKILNWLYDNYLEQVRHHVLRNSGSEADVPDVFQESIIALYRQITENHLNLTTDLKGYFYGIARNIWNSQLRKRMPSTAIDADTPDDSTLDEAGDKILERIISRVFNKLSDDNRTILTLFAEGLSFQEIAEEMDLKNETYARRKKYLSKEALLDLIREDPEYNDYLGLL